MRNYLLLLSFLKILIFCLLCTLQVAYSTLYERKLLGCSQQRSGPFEVGFRGRLQPFADSFKLLSKGLIFITSWSKVELLIYCSASVLLVYLFWINIFLGLYGVISDIEYNIILVIILSCIFGYSVLHLGVLTKNKFALIACLRYTLVLLNGELVFGFLWSFIIIIIESSAFSLVQFLFKNNYLIFIFLPIVFIIIICFCIEVGRTPTDFGESESELVAGYITELSGFLFTLFYLGEYFHLFTFSNFYAVILV